MLSIFRIFLNHFVLQSLDIWKLSGLYAMIITDFYTDIRKVEVNNGEYNHKRTGT